jgi:anthranilate synthase component 2
MIILIDNYDSFTFNLVHFLGELGATVEVHRNDAITPEQVLAAAPQGIVLSPGPCDPDKAGICLDLVRANDGRVPLLGVCLGHQSVGQAYGGHIVRAPAMMHGKTSAVHHDGTGLFHGLPNPFTATRYHSLVVDPESVPDCLEVTARTDDGVIMALAHRDKPVFGVQFHPESIASEQGHELLANFLAITGQRKAA